MSLYIHIPYNLQGTIRVHFGFKFKLDFGIYIPIKFLNLSFIYVSIFLRSATLISFITFNVIKNHKKLLRFFYHDSFNRTVCARFLPTAECSYFIVTLCSACLTVTIPPSSFTSPSLHPHCPHCASYIFTPLPPSCLSLLWYILFCTYIT